MITVNAQQELMITVYLIIFVTNVMSNVKNVPELLITVPYVLETESENLTVTVHQEP